MELGLDSVPASAGMAGLAAGVRSFPPTLPPIVYGLLTGLNAAAVGLIALAAYQLSTSSVTDGITRLIVLGSASFGVCYHAPWVSGVGFLISTMDESRKSWIFDMLISFAAPALRCIRHWLLQVVYSLSRLITDYKF